MRIAASCLLVFVLSSSFAADYYVSPTGNDANLGTSASTPWKSINTALARAAAGAVIHLEAGATFTENIYIRPGVGSAGTQSNPIRLTSDPLNRAIIKPINNTSAALFIYNAAGLVIENLRCIGPGMDTHQNDGAGAYADNGRYYGLTVRRCEFTGFGKHGFYVSGWGASSYGYGNVLVEDCEFHDNRKGGMITSAQYASGNTNVTVRRCKAYNNLGDPAATTHTGSGIILGNVTDGLMEHCIAYNNGARSTTVGGPVGLWSWDSTRVTIQFCESYQNHAVNADGGGFDLDGGCQNCIIQYCYSHDNDGAGYLLAQYSGARAYSNNTIRYNISQNDGRRNGYAGLHFWSSGSNGGLQYSKIYGNVIYNEFSNVVRFENTSGQSGTKLWNNIFVSKNSKVLLSGSPPPAVAQFQGNAYWANGGTFNVAGYSSLSGWRTAMGQEMLNGGAVGLQTDPLLVSAGGGGTIGNTASLNTLGAYKLQSTSPAIDTGLDLPTLFGLNPGTRDFYGNALPQLSGYDIGAHEFAAATVPAAPAGVTASVGNSQVTLSWSAVNGATSYIVKRSTVYGGPYLDIATGLAATSFTNTGLTNGTTYYYVVSALNSYGESPDSLQVSAKPLAPPAAPTGLTATPGSGQVVLNWTAASSATSYSVKRATTSGGPYSNVATGLSGTSYTNTGLTNGVTYYYVVSARNAGGESPNSPQISATPQAGANVAPVANAQSVNTAEDTSRQITLSASDANADVLTFSIVSQPSKGTLSGAPPLVTYTPAGNYFGSDSFTFKARDGALDSNIATVSISISSVNDAPVAYAQTLSTNRRTPVALTLRASDLEANPLTYTIVTQPAHGTLSGAPPNLTYTPRGNVTGADYFTFKASDATRSSNVATVTVQVLKI